MRFEYPITCDPVNETVYKGYPEKMTKRQRTDSPKRRYWLAAVFLLVMLSACSTGLTVRSDSDPNADFSRYHTYNFFDPMGIEGGYNSPIFGEEFRAALTGEMNRRGYRLSDEPDLLINVTLRSDDKVRIRSFTAPYMTGAYYARPGGAYYGSALGVGISAGTGVSEKTEASVFIDLVDFAERRVVWQGVAVANVSDKVARELHDAIFTAVDRVMAEYPYTAGK